MLLAVPLTVCLVVLGEHIPLLGYLRTLFGDAPEVDPGVLFFHRALGGDSDGAAVLIGEQADTPLAEVYEKVLLPALAQAKAEQARGELESEEVRRVHRTVRPVLAGARGAAAGRSRFGNVWAGRDRVRGRWAWDRIALGMLCDLVAEEGGELMMLSAAKLATEIERRKGSALVCIAAIAPGGLSRAAQLCQQVRGEVGGACAGWPVGK